MFSFKSIKVKRRFFQDTKADLPSPLGGVSLKGFTFVEIMVTAVVLSLGILFIYQGFLTSLGGFNYCVDYLNAQSWVDEKIWDIQDRLSHYKTLLTEDREGDFVIRNKRFNWQLSYNLIEGLKDMSLYEVGLKVFWKEGLNKVKTERTTYVLYKER